MSAASASLGPPVATVLGAPPPSPNVPAVSKSLGPPVATVLGAPAERAAAGIVPALLLQRGDWAFVFGNADYLLGGAVWTVALTAASVALGFLVGFPAGAVEVYTDGPLKRLVEVLGVVLRGTPIVVIMVYFFFVIQVSESAFATAVLALGLRSAAYQSQIFRGALQSVDEGQLEAARAIGLSPRQAVLYVTVPQALRRSVPSFQNEFTIVLKDTSVAFAIGVGELLKRSYDMFPQQAGTAVFEIVVFASAVYFVLTFATNRTLDRVNAKFAIPSGGEQR